MAASHLQHEKFWSNKAECEDAEARYYAKLYGKSEQTEKVAAEKATDSDNVDLFASDEEPVEKPVPKKVEKTKPAPSKASKAEKKAAPAVKENKPAAPKPQPSQKPAPPAKDAAEKKEEVSSQQHSGYEGESLYQNAANGQRSFIMLKPDAVHRGLVGEIVARFERKGYKMVAMKFMQASQELLKNHYADLSKKPFFPELIRYMSSGPVVPMVWEGVNVVKTGRMMLGETNPRDSLPGTIRGDYCIDVGRNIIHGSDSVESAKREIAMWFSEAELPKWRPVATPWIYENEDLETSASAAPSKVDGLAALTSAGTMELQTKLNSLEKENKTLKKVTDDLKALVLKLEGRVSQLEKSGSGSSAPAAPAKAAPVKEEEEEDEDVDLFGSDSEDEEESAEKVRVREERLKAYAEKKAKKPALIAKTSVLLDIKPWDDETDMDAMLKSAKTIEKDGLVWGAHKLVPVGYGINKLQLMCVVEDEKVSIDELCEQIAEFEDYVQSVDISAMSKI